MYFSVDGIIHHWATVITSHTTVSIKGNNKNLNFWLSDMKLICIRCTNHKNMSCSDKRLLIIIRTDFNKYKPMISLQMISAENEVSLFI